MTNRTATDQPAARARLLPRPVRHRLARCAAWLHRRLELYTGRRAAARLLSLDDRTLADIGIDRSDVVAALAAPRDIDPTVVLAGRRRCRAAADRARRPAEVSRARAPRPRA